MIQLPLGQVPTQTQSMTLGNQAVQITLRQNGAAMYLDLYVEDAPILVGKVCRDRQRLLVGLEYRGFQGDLMFVDMLGNTDPFFTGLTSRYVLAYLTAAEVAAL